MKKFHIRDIIIFTVLVAVVCGWAKDHLVMQADMQRVVLATDMVWHDLSKIAEARDFAKSRCEKCNIEMDTVVKYHPLRSSLVSYPPEPLPWLHSAPNDNSKMVLVFSCPLCRAEEISSVLNK
ncbi:MAG: hypothetical protein ABL888_14240 [Pirellulaceae bacterium]